MSTAPPVIPPLDVAAIIARELALPRADVARTLALVDDGATVPFMARYRKEVTGGMDEVQLQALAARAPALAQLGARRKTVIETIAAPGKLPDQLAPRLLAPPARPALQ